MSIDVTPGSVFTANMNEAPMGLVGTLTVAIFDPLNDDYPTPAQTGGIAETPASSGNYYATLTAPTIGGTYSVIWDNAGTVVTEDLIVTYSALPNSDLCTIADVRAFLKKPDSDTQDDAIFQTLITAASDEIPRYCSRQFTPDAANPRSHRFRSSHRMIDLAPYDLQSADTVTLNPQSTSPTTLTEWTDYELLPIDGDASMGTFYILKLYRHLSCYGGRHFIVDVDGTWGAASIPPIVRQAAYVTVAEWFRAKVAGFSTTFNEDGVHVAPAPLPTMVCGWLDALKRHPQA